MTPSFRFHFYLTGRRAALCRSDGIWQAPLPLKRGQRPDDTPALLNPEATYGAYFEAVTDFLSWRNFRRLREAVGVRRQLSPERLDFSEIRVFLEKHGALYHPARIETIAADYHDAFVLNVAVSPAGAAVIQREFSLIEELNRLLPDGYLPRVYSLGEGGGPGLRHWPLFLGEWFEGFSECHLTRQPADGAPGILVWDASNGVFFLSEAQTHQFYRQVALILTAYYDLSTTRQIFPWHHAAGDFVVQCQNSRLAVRLITARQFSPIVSTPLAPFDAMAETLFFFLANLSIQTRLDRLEGVGALAWSDDLAVGETLEGFLMGLKNKHPTLSARFLDYLGSFSREEIGDFFQAVLKTVDSRAPEFSLISTHLEDHADLMFHAVQKRASETTDTT
jgi:hypothetical protein